MSVKQELERKDGIVVKQKRRVIALSCIDFLFIRSLRLLYENGNDD